MLHHRRHSFYSFVLLLTFLLACGLQDPSIVYGAGGQVTGRVTDASGTPISGVRVRIYTESYLKGVWTDSSGNYNFTELASGNYKVEFEKTGYADVWYNGASSEAAATIVTVTAPNVTSGIDGVIGVGGQITGRVTDASGTPISGVTVYLFPSSGSIAVFSLAAASPDSIGNYTFAGFASGAYKVMFRKSGYADVWYNGANSWDDGTIVTVTSPNVTSGIDGIMGVGGQITGRVTDASGTPISDVLVSLYTSTGSYLTLASPDSIGNYAFAGIASGTYKVMFRKTGYADVWYNGASSEAAATIVTVISPNVTSGIDGDMSGHAHLYFPHVATSMPWQAEIAIINTSSDLTVTGTLRGLSNAGQLIETKDVTLSARGRRQIIVANEFTNHADIGYITFDTTSAAVQGYTKFYQEGTYRAAIPAVKEVNTSNIYIPHIASNADWWTGISLVNTTSARKDLTITFNNGQTVPYTLNANEHKAFLIESLLNNQPQPDIQSAVINNANGVIGLELFGSIGDGNQLDGILLTDDTASTIYYPHVASNDTWWTGIVAYNPSESACTITVTSYNAAGTPLSITNLSLSGKEKYIGLVEQLSLPAQTAWFKIDSTSPLTGFELFGSFDGKQLVAYAGTGAKMGVFAKIEKNGWTGIAFVNMEAGAASVTLTAYNDNGSAVATQVLSVGGYAKVVDQAENIFSQDISGATYIAYSSDRNVVGFQLNGTSDGLMLDGLPGLAGTN